MTEQWLGLHNPERHTTFASSGGAATCSRETGWCTPERPCGCCMDEEARRLKAEVEALRAQVAELRGKWHHACAVARIEALRELHRNHDDCPDGYAMCAGRGMCYACGKHWPCTTIRILDGGDA